MNVYVVIYENYDEFELLGVYSSYDEAFRKHKINENFKIYKRKVI